MFAKHYESQLKRDSIFCINSHFLRIVVFNPKNKTVSGFFSQFYFEI